MPEAPRRRARDHKAQCSTCSRRDLGTGREDAEVGRDRGTAHQPAPRATRDCTRFILHNVKLDTTSVALTTSQALALLALHYCGPHGFLHINLTGRINDQTPGPPSQLFSGDWTVVGQIFILRMCGLVPSYTTHHRGKRST